MSSVTEKSVQRKGSLKIVENNPFEAEKNGQTTEEKRTVEDLSNAEVISESQLKDFLNLLINSA